MINRLQQEKTKEKSSKERVALDSFRFAFFLI